MITITHCATTKIIELQSSEYSILANSLTDDISIKIVDEIKSIDFSELDATIFQFSTLVDTQFMKSHIDVIKIFREKYRHKIIMVNESDTESKLCMRRGNNSIERCYIDNNDLQKYIHFNVQTMQYFVDDSFDTYLTDDIDDQEFSDLCMIERIKYALYH